MPYFDLNQSINLYALPLNHHLFTYFSVYNLGEYRRSATSAYKNHEFFRSENQVAMAIRTECAVRALEDACQWLSEKGEVAVSILRTHFDIKPNK